MSRRSYPLGWYADELEHEGLDTTGLLQSEGFCVKPAHEELVEVSYECRQQQEYGVLCHERLWQPGPSESVIHIVEDAFLAAPEVVELHDFPCGGRIVVGQDAAVYDNGVWQDKKYLVNVDIPFKKLILSDRNRGIQEIIMREDSIAIHIRRGDYLKPQYVGRYVHLCETDYYKRALEVAKGISPNYTCFFFSDDIKWVKEHFAIEGAYYVDWNKGNDSFYDMYLMSHAKVNIITNSTFSFWAARLNRRATLVIYPLSWYSDNSDFVNPDIFPQCWIGL